MPSSNHITSPAVASATPEPIQPHAEEPFNHHTDAAGATLPPWLQEIEAHAPSDEPHMQEGTATYTQETTSPPAKASDELPPWLLDSTPDVSDDQQSDAGERVTPTAATEDTLAHRSEETNEYALPPWLADAGTTDAAWEPPPWLNEDTAAPPEATGAASEAITPAGQPTPSDESLPDWLREMGTPAQEERATPPLGSPVASSLPVVDTDLARVRQDHAGRQQDTLAAWLSAEQGADEAATAAPEATRSPSGDALPDWLHEASSAPVAEAQPGAQEAQHEAPSQARVYNAEPAPATTPDEDLPDWLRDDTSPLASTQSGEPDDDDLPEWLRDDTPSTTTSDTYIAAGSHTSPPEAERPAAQESESREASPAADAARESVGPLNHPAVDPARESSEPGLPVWLRDEQQAPSTALPDVPADEPALTPEEQATLPEWLRDDIDTSAVSPPVTEDVPPVQAVPATQASSTPQEREPDQADDAVLRLLNEDRRPADTAAIESPAATAPAPSTPPSPPLSPAPSVPEQRSLSKPDPAQGSSWLVILLIVLLVLALAALGWYAWSAGWI